MSALGLIVSGLFVFLAGGLLGAGIAWHLLSKVERLRPQTAVRLASLEREKAAREADQHMRRLISAEMEGAYGSRGFHNAVVRVVRDAAARKVIP